MGSEILCLLRVESVFDEDEVLDPEFRVMIFENW